VPSRWTERANGQDHGQNLKKSRALPITCLMTAQAVAIRLDIVVLWKFSS
jgi:hypothetical protein